MADQEQIPKTRPPLKTIDVNYAYAKHDGEDDDGGIHKVKAKAVDVAGRVVIEGDVAVYSSNASRSPMALVGDIMGAILRPISGENTASVDAADDDHDFRERIETELFDTNILDPEGSPTVSEDTAAAMKKAAQAPFFGGLNVGINERSNQRVAGLLGPTDNTGIVRECQIHFAGNLSDDERATFIAGLMFTFACGEKPYVNKVLRQCSVPGEHITVLTTGRDIGDGDNVYGAEVGDPRRGGIYVAARQNVWARCDFSKEALALVPKLKLFRCVLIVTLTRDVC